jgi:hypothetical protein
VRNPFLFFLTPLAQRRTYLLRKLNAVLGVSRLRARPRAARRLSFGCWTSQKSNIKVASEALASTTTFTRHHAFLKKATQKLS